eukprot:scaffold3778_cov207-Skeletonema_marinoi.AAC.1
MITIVDSDPPPQPVAQLLGVRSGKQYVTNRNNSVVACGCSGSNSFYAMDDDRACLSRQLVLQKMPTSH